MEKIVTNRTNRVFCPYIYIPYISLKGKKGVCPVGNSIIEEI